MEGLKRKKKTIYLVLGLLAFLLLAFCPSIDIVMGYAPGYFIVFHGEDLGISQLLLALTILAPLAAGLISFLVPAKSADLLEIILFGSTVVLGIIANITFPGRMGMGLSLAFCGWFALFLCLCGAGVGILAKK